MWCDIRESEKGRETERQRDMEEGTSTESTRVLSLNDFPEHILLHILSYLPTLDAIQTCLLSRKWRYLWTTIPSLYFNYSLFDSRSENRRSFSEFVDRTLILRSHSRLLRFHLQFDYAEDRYGTHLDSWVRYAINHHVVDIDLDFFIDRVFHTADDDAFYDFPFSALRNGCVRVLKLCRCDITLPTTTSSMRFRSLRSLSLDQIYLTDEMVSDMLLGCECLEDLVLAFCYGMKDLKIRSSSLKKLSLSYFHSCDDASVEISCTSLRSLSIISFEVGRYALNDALSLVDANVFFLHKADYYMYWDKVVRLVGNVKCLTVQNWWFKLPKDVFSESSALYNLKYLELQTGYSKFDLLGIAALLELSPNLETMILDYLSKKDEDESLSEEFLNKPISFNLPKLRQVKIKSYRGTEDEKNFTKLLQKNGVVLEKIVLDPGKLGETSFTPVVLVRRPQGVKVLEGSPHSNFQKTDL